MERIRNRLLESILYSLATFFGALITALIYQRLFLELGEAPVGFEFNVLFFLSFAWPTAFVESLIILFLFLAQKPMIGPNLSFVSTAILASVAHGFVSIPWGIVLFPPMLLICWFLAQKSRTRGMTSAFKSIVLIHGLHNSWVFLLVFAVAP